jgi:glycosyltransferase involved in cell wall biosynthesis
MTRHNPERVLWLTKGLGLGGTERIVSMGAGTLDPERYSLEVAFVLSHKSALVGDLRSNGTGVHDLGAAGGGFRWMFALMQLLRRSRYTIVHTHSPVPAVVARLVPLHSRPLFVHTEHSAWERYRLPTRLANAVTMRRNNAVIAVSESVAKSMRSSRVRRFLTGSEPRVIYHGIDESAVRSGPAARRAARDALGYGEDARLIGTVGSLTAKKDQATLLRALALTGTEARLVLMGDGPLKQELHDLVRELGLSEHVTLLGVRTDVQLLLPGFDLFILPSRHEGLGLVLLEAMAAGVCCIGTDVGGIPEVIEDGVNGVLVPVADPPAMAAAIDALLTDDARCRRLAEAGKKSVASFSISRAMAEVAAIYDRA